MRTPENELPQVTFHGDASLDDFHTVDGVMAEDLVKWDSLRFNGIDANLNPQTVAIREIDVDNAYARLVIETNKHHQSAQRAAPDEHQRARDE